MSDVYMCLHFAYMSFSPFGRTKNFCCGIVTHIVVGNFSKNVKKFYLKFLGGGFNQTLSIYWWKIKLSNLGVFPNQGSKDLINSMGNLKFSRTCCKGAIFVRIAKKF